MAQSYVIIIKNYGSRGTEFAKIFNDHGMRIAANFTNKEDGDTAKRLIEYMRTDSTFISASVEQSGE